MTLYDISHCNDDYEYARVIQGALIDISKYIIGLSSYARYNSHRRTLFVVSRKSYRNKYSSLARKSVKKRRYNLAQRSNTLEGYIRDEYFSNVSFSDLCVDSDPYEIRYRYSNKIRRGIKCDA